MSNISRQRRRLQKPVVRWKHPSALQGTTCSRWQIEWAPVTTSREKLLRRRHLLSSINETSRARSIATRLTDAEFGEVEAAAADAGKKVAEWLREAALAHARASAGAEEQTDPILLAEIMGMRSLMLNLFARASEGSTDNRRFTQDVGPFGLH